MRRLIAALLVFLALFGATACGGIEAARDAGERAAGDPKGEAENGPPKPDRRPVAGASGAEETTGAAEKQAQAAGGTLETSEPVLDEKWYKDSDGNFVPDFVEVAEGYDPRRDDCAIKGGCPGGAESIDFYTEPRNALLLLDSSGSMAADDGTGRTKMEAAKEAIGRYSEVSSVVYETGFAVFGHTGNTTRAGKRQSCGEAAEVLLPPGEMDGGSFKGVVGRLRPTGWTPIEGALREAEKVFAGHEGETNRVILVSDGIETCGGDPVAAAEELRRSGIGLTVDVVGFGVSDDDARQLEDIATAGGGEYRDAETGADLDAYFSEQADAMEQTVDASGCWLGAGLSAINCDLGLCNEARFYYFYVEQRKHDYGGPEWEAFEDLSDRMDAEYEEREKAYKQAIDKSGELRDQYAEMSKEYSRAVQEAYGGT